jgi:hypothetical protein
MIVIAVRQTNNYRYLEYGFIFSNAEFCFLNISICTSIYVIAAVNGYNIYIIWIFIKMARRNRFDYIAKY